MIAFPSSTNVHRKLPKEAFYRNLSLNQKLKDKFISDVEKIYVENSFTAKSLNLNAESETKEILLLAITLKKQAFDAKILEAIAKQNPHKLVFLLCFADKRQLAIYQGKLYCSEWSSETEITLQMEGVSLDAIWERFTKQIQYLEKVARLQKQIAALQTKVRKEKQLNKQVQLNAELKKLKRELEEI